MKHQLGQRSVEQIEQLVRKLTPEAPLATPDIIAGHLASLLEANKSTNLTAIRDEAEAVRLHVEDSLLFASRIGRLMEERARVADLGSGGGLPAIPLAAATGLPFELVESVGKKCRFLEEYLQSEQRLGGCRVHCARAEELAATDRGEFGLITARALTALPSLVELAAPLLRTGGRLAALKAAPSAEERERGIVAAKLCGLAMTEVLYSELSGGETRTLVVFEKRAESGVGLPRRPGMAQRKPLA